MRFSDRQTIWRYDMHRASLRILSTGKAQSFSFERLRHLASGASEIASSTQLQLDSGRGAFEVSIKLLSRSNTAGWEDRRERRLISMDLHPFIFCLLSSFKEPLQFPSKKSPVVTRRWFSSAFSSEVLKALNRAVSIFTQKMDMVCPPFSFSVSCPAEFKT